MLKLDMLDNDSIETMIYIQSISSVRMNLYNIDDSLKYNVFERKTFNLSMSNERNYR